MLAFQIPERLSATDRFIRVCDGDIVRLATDRLTIIRGVAATWELAMSSLASQRAHTAGDTVVETASGKVRGVYANGVAQFKGIPYGATTVGEGRFLRPRPVQAWPGVRDALTVGRSTPQPGRTMNVPWWAWITDDQPQSEDCLVLNVYAPEVAASRKLPVMFYLHGGGFNTGSASTAGTDGTQLARLGDVVVVTINHRLNVFGFLYLAELAGGRFADNANAGMLDAVAALQWVKRNISGVRRRSGQCDDLRSVGWRVEGGRADGDAGSQRPVPQGDRPERVVADQDGHAGAGGARGEGTVR